MTSEKASREVTAQPRNELGAALAACRSAIIALGDRQHAYQCPLPERLDLHAGGLRPRAAEPQHSHAGRPIGPGWLPSTASRAFSTSCADASWSASADRWASS